MKQFSAIMIVFLFLVVGIVGVVVVFKFIEGDQLKKAETQYQNYIQKYGQQRQAPSSSSQVSAASLTNDLQTTVDDGGKSDFDQLQNDLGGL